ncbi:MAG: S8 family serine peptidase [Caldilineaceae bacterium]
MKRCINLILITLLLWSAIPPSSTYAQSEKLRVDPQLLQLTQSRSNEPVKIIVQREPQAESTLPTLARSALVPVRDLPLINGFATEVPADAIAELARTPGISWISLDSPVRSMTAPISYGEDGVVTTAIGSSAAAYAIALQPDGKIVAAGTTWMGRNIIALTRYNGDGTVDTSFGSNGSVITNVTYTDDRGLAVAVQPDGKLVVAGHVYNGSNFDIAVIRYQSNGALDTSFGYNGRVTTNINGHENVSGVLLQSDGKILVIGRENSNHLALIRYKTNGALDSTFDGDGIVVTDVIRGNWYGVPAAIQSDGKIVLTGTANFGSGRGYDIVTARYNSNGAIDTSFHGDGYAVTQLSSGDDRGNAITIQPDGKLVVMGISDNGNDFDIAVLRYNSNGSLDSTFGGDGIVTTQLNGDDYGHFLAVQPNGKLMVGGVTYIWNGARWDGKVALLRYTSSGVLDPSFDGDGYATTQVTGNDNYGFSMAMQQDGKVVIAGYIDSGAAYQFTTLRYTSQGSLDIPISPVIPAVRVNQLRQELPALQGAGIGVAVVDSGINNHPDLKIAGSNTSRIVSAVDFSHSGNTNDSYGHGTHVAGIIGGNGATSNGVRVGVAPQVNLINVKVSNANGVSYISDVIQSLYWVYQNKSAYNIRVVNLSMNSVVPESYHFSPLSVAVELLWFNGIVVVVAAGNNGTGNGPVTLYPPANDPFVITVGATDQVGTATISDDTVPFFSAYGWTEQGFAKPDLVAPGRDIVSLLADTSATAYQLHPTHRVDNYLFRLSGTSMAAPVVSGAVALLLQDEPNLTPDQVKYRLKATANHNWAHYNSTLAGAGYLDVYAAVQGSTTQSANTGTLISQALFGGFGTIAWDSVSWNSVSWNSVSWNSVSWNSVSWNSSSGSSDIWSSNVWDDSLAVEPPATSEQSNGDLFSNAPSHSDAEVEPGASPAMVATPTTTDGVTEATLENTLFLPLVAQ